MIAHINGVVAEKLLSVVIVDVGGVGYEIQVTSVDGENITLGKEVKLYTYHHVREQAEELYGFSSLTAKRLFEMLITVQGVGPKAALAILSLADASQVQSAISNRDSTYIANASGVGKKTADRIIVDLADKVGSPLVSGRATSLAKKNDDALDALMALGFSLSDAISALENVDSNLSTAERVTQALKKAS